MKSSSPHHDNETGPDTTPMPTLQFSPEAEALAHTSQSVYNFLHRYIRPMLLLCAVMVLRFCWEYVAMASAPLVAIEQNAAWGPQEYLMRFRRPGQHKPNHHQFLRLDGSMPDQSSIESVLLTPTIIATFAKKIRS